MGNYKIIWGVKTTDTDASSPRRKCIVCGSRRTRHGRVVHIINRNMTCNPLSPTTFITYLERVMDGLRDNGTGISTHGYQLNNLRFADDIDLIEERQDMLQANINTLNAAV